MMMQLGSLLQALDANVRVFPELTSAQRETSITDITSDSRHVNHSSVFVAVVGTNFDGHNAIDDAVARGARAVVIERVPSGPLPVPLIHVKDTRLAYSALVVALQHNPSSRLRVFGVTGTNGKTTCATLMEQLYSAAGRNVGFVGTTGNRYGGIQYPTSYSTPHAGELASLFSQMAESGVDTVCMEVSSHALDQHRVFGINYRGALFTNLTRDHLDYHGTMENYAKAKKRLFDGLQPDAIAVLWGESEWSSYMKRHCNARQVVMVGTGAGNHVQISDVSLSVSGTSFTLNRRSAELDQLPQSLTVHTRLLGEFNVANVALVTVLAILDGMPSETVVKIVQDLHGPKGRMEVYHTEPGVTAVVDYAHTPDALENVLRVVRQFASAEQNTRLVHVVFGCGGDRDKGKRAEMGRIASILADHVYITNDNPRTERPTDIVNNIMGGVDATLRSNVTIIEDRRAAIHQALSQAGPDDVVIIAGKGHEEYQIVGNDRLPFSDAEEILAWSAKHKKAPL